MMPQEMDDRDGLCPEAERDSEIDLGRVMNDLNGGEPGEDDAEFDDYEDFEFEPEVEYEGDYEDEDPDAGDDEDFDGDDEDDEEFDFSDEEEDDGAL